MMEGAGLPEPYQRLLEKPDRVPQWCRKHWLEAGDRKGGGRHRRDGVDGRQYGGDHVGSFAASQAL